MTDPILERTFQNDYRYGMARTKEFDPEAALSAAIDLFWLRGYANTSMQDVVEELALHRGSLYATFGSKRELFLAALERYCREAPQPLVEAMGRAGPLLPRLRAAFVALVEEDLAGPQRRGCMLINSVMETMPGDPDTAELFARTTGTLRATFASAVRRAQAEGEVRRDLDPQAAGTFLVTTLQGLRVMAKGAGDRRQLLAAIDLALAALA